MNRKIFVKSTFIVKNQILCYTNNNHTTYKKCSMIFLALR